MTDEAQEPKTIAEWDAHADALCEAREELMQAIITVRRHIKQMKAESKGRIIIPDFITPKGGDDAGT